MTDNERRMMIADSWVRWSYLRAGLEVKEEDVGRYVGLLVDGRATPDEVRSRIAA